LKHLWQELDQRRPIKTVCAQDIKIRQEEIMKDRIYDFLAGLDDVFDKVHSDFLQTKPLPGLDEAFGYIRRETQSQIIMLGGSSPSGALVDPAVAMISKASVNGSTEKDGIICSYCKKRQRNEDNCLKKIAFLTSTWTAESIPMGKI
jgi:hypothetical protein